MSRIEIGQIIKTNYDTGPYRVVSIVRGCTCPHVLDDMNAKRPHEEPDPLPPHAHLYLRGTEDAAPHNRGEEAWIGYLDEETLRTYGAGGKLTRDRVILLKNPVPIQTSIAFAV